MRGAAAVVVVVVAAEAAGWRWTRPREKGPVVAFLP